MIAFALLFLVAIGVSQHIGARESVGVFGSWGAFTDPKVPRCYAIALGRSKAPGMAQGFATISHWPRNKISNQFYVQLSRNVQKGRHVKLVSGQRTMTLQGAGRHAWAQNRAMDAAIAALMRAQGEFRVSAVDENGRAFTDSYTLAGAATAIDAAALACAKLDKR